MQNGIAVQDAETTENVVAKVGDTGYTSLPAALSAAQDGETVTLLADHTTDENDVTTRAVVTKTLTLDLNGCTVDQLEVGNMTYDGVDETGELQNVSYTPGNLTVVTTSGGTMGTIKELELVKGTLDVRSGQIGYDEDGGGIGGGLTCDEDSGTVTICGGRVLGLTVNENATVTVSGGSGHAGTWSNNNGKLTITGGEFGDISFKNNGGAIAISGGTFNMPASILGAYIIQFLPTTLYKYKVPPTARPAYKAIVVIILVVLSAPAAQEKLTRLWKRIAPRKAVKEAR